MKANLSKVVALAVVFTAFLAMSVSASAQQPVTFAPPVSYPSGDGTPPGSKPTGVTNGDFDNDGDVDLAVANIADSSFSVFLNNGDGTFAPGVTTRVASPSSGGPTPRPMGIDSGDLNRDGNLDLAVTSPPNGGVFVFFGDGDGTFDGTFAGLQNPTFLPAGTRTFGVLIANLDADSRPDIAVTNLGPRGTANDFARDTISVFRNNPDQTGQDGTFASAVNYPAGYSPSSVTNADFDGDGNTDLAVTNDRPTAETNDVSIFLGSREGTFTPAPAGFAAGDFPTAIDSADFDGNDKPDLVVANLGPEPATPGASNGPDTVSVLLNKTKNKKSCKGKKGNNKKQCQKKNKKNKSVFGELNFETANYPAGDGPRAVTTADFNGDNDPDFAVSYQNETTTPILSVFLNNGDGTFEPRQDFAGGSDSRGITSADLNGGKPDLVAPDRGPTQDALLVLLNTTP